MSNVRQTNFVVIYLGNTLFSCFFHHLFGESGARWVVVYAPVISLEVRRYLCETGKARVEDMGGGGEEEGWLEHLHNLVYMHAAKTRGESLSSIGNL